MKDLTWKEYLKIKPNNELIDAGLQPIKTRFVDCRKTFPYIDPVTKEYCMMYGPRPSKWWDGTALVHFYANRGYGKRRGAKEIVVH